MREAPIKAVHIYIATVIMVGTAFWTAGDIGRKVGEANARLDAVVYSNERLSMNVEALARQVQSHETSITVSQQRLEAVEKQVERTPAFPKVR